jgi:hypothetical protein
LIENEFFVFFAQNKIWCFCTEEDLVFLHREIFGAFLQRE